MNIVFTEWGNALVYLLIAVVLFVLSFTVRGILFRELDYYEIKYTSKTKRRTLWVIFSSLVSITLWLRILQLLLSRLQY